MDRYLVFSPNLPQSLTLAREICNRNWTWIDEAIDMRDMRVVEWLRSTDHQTLTGPAIIKIEQGRVSVVEGEVFKRRTQQMLGPMQAAELMKVLQGDALVPTSASSNSAREHGANPGNVRKTVAPRARSTVDRRRFLGLGD